MSKNKTKNNRRTLKTLLLLLFLSIFLEGFITPNIGKTQSGSNPGESGSIKGRVEYKGGHVEKEKNLIKDEHTCGAGAIVDESLLTSPDGGVQWAVVSISSNIKNGKGLNALQTNGILDQSSCVFKPHVVLVGVDKPLVVINSDKTLHNVRTVSFLNEQISKAQIAFPGSPVVKDTIVFTEAEVVETVCDVHGWMKAYIHVVEHPYYAVTSDVGSFQLENVPPGKYTLKVWHETLGELEQEIMVPINGLKNVTFSYKKK